jgi:hypothetical protein
MKTTEEISKRIDSINELLYLNYEYLIRHKAVLNQADRDEVYTDNTQLNLKKEVLNWVLNRE